MGFRDEIFARVILWRNFSGGIGGVAEQELSLEGMKCIGDREIFGWRNINFYCRILKEIDTSEKEEKYVLIIVGRDKGKDFGSDDMVHIFQDINSCHFCCQNGNNKDYNTSGLGSIFIKIDGDMGISILTAKDIVNKASSMMGCMKGEDQIISRDEDQIIKGEEEKAECEVMTSQGIEEKEVLKMDKMGKVVDSNIVDDIIKNRRLEKDVANDITAEEFDRDATIGENDRSETSHSK